LKDVREQIHLFAFRWYEQRILADGTEDTNQALSKRYASVSSASFHASLRNSQTLESKRKESNVSQLKFHGSERQPQQLESGPPEKGQKAKAKVNYLLEAAYHLDRCSDQLIDGLTRAKHLQRQIDFFWTVQICPEAIRLYEKLCQHWEKFPDTATTYDRGKYAAIVSDCYHTLMQEDKVCCNLLIQSYNLSNLDFFDRWCNI
jgi:hypothetical protein